MEVSKRRCSIWWWFWTYVVVNMVDTKLFNYGIIGIDHGRSGVTAATPSWFVVRRGRPLSCALGMSLCCRNSLGCCCRNSLSPVIYPLNQPFLTHYDPGACTTAIIGRCCKSSNGNASVVRLRVLREPQIAVMIQAPLMPYDATDPGQYWNRLSLLACICFVFSYVLTYWDWMMNICVS